MPFLVLSFGSMIELLLMAALADPFFRSGKYVNINEAIASIGMMLCVYDVFFRDTLIEVVADYLFMLWSSINSNIFDCNCHSARAVVLFLEPKN